MTTATVRETEAEAVAFIVGQSVGLDMGTASSDYIHMYAGNAALLAESLEVIQRTSAVILAAIQPENPPRRTKPLRSWRKPANRDFDDADGPAPSAQLLVYAYPLKVEQAIVPETEPTAESKRAA